NEGDRLPGQLRARLSQSKQPILMFNPRGEDLCAVASVQRIGGLVLHCIDPDEAVIQNLRISNEARTVFGQWRVAADRFLRGHGKKEIRAYVQGWALRDPGSG